MLTAMLRDKEAKLHESEQERIRTATRVRACNYVKIETGRNLFQYQPMIAINLFYM